MARQHRFSSKKVQGIFKKIKATIHTHTTALEALVAIVYLTNLHAQVTKEVDEIFIRTFVIGVRERIRIALTKELRRSEARSEINELRYIYNLVFLPSDDLETMFKAKLEQVQKSKVEKKPTSSRLVPHTVAGVYDLWVYSGVSKKEADMYLTYKLSKDILL